MGHIPYPTKISEGEIQATLWNELRIKKIDARLQVPASVFNSLCLTTKPDIVVFVDRKPICVIECKSWTEDYSKSFGYRGNNKYQIGKYIDSWHLPTFIIGRMENIGQIISSVEDIIAKTPKSASIPEIFEPF